MKYIIALLFCIAACSEQEIAFNQFNMNFASGILPHNLERDCVIMAIKRGERYNTIVSHGLAGTLVGTAIPDCNNNYQPFTDYIINFRGKLIYQGLFTWNNTHFIAWNGTFYYGIDNSYYIVNGKLSSLITSWIPKF